MAWLWLSCLLLPLLLAALLYMTRRRWLASFARLPQAQYAVAVQRNLPVPMQDGAVLLADHYYPKAQGSFPTVLIRSPWGRGWEKAPLSLAYLFVAGRFAERGYHVIVHSTRNRPDPQHAFYPDHEGDDGLAVLHWIEQQPWCNGAIGWWGPSYLGYIQWATAVHAPAALKALVPIATTANWRDFFYHDGAPALERLLNIVYTTGLSRLSPPQILGRLRSQAQAVAAAAAHLPLNEADIVLSGAENPGYRAVLAYPFDDEDYWGPLDLRNQLAQVTAAVHLVAGWRDIFLRQQLADYAALTAAGHNPYLTIGPWGHTDSDLSGAGIREGLAWFDAHLAGHAGGLRALPVRLYVMRADKWLDLPVWPPPTTDAIYYLAAERQLTPTLGAAEGSDAFRYDPANPTPALGGAQLGAGAWLVDNAVLEGRGDVLTYTSAPLPAALTVMGAPQVTLHVHASAASADCFVRLCVVEAGGRSANICDGFARFTPRERVRADGADEAAELQIVLEPTATLLRSGERLRLLVAGGAHPRWNRNLGAPGGDVYATALLAADHTVYYGPTHSSALHLPIVADPIALEKETADAAA
jgi:putative CocE/NonD family hydrolase